LKYEKNDEFKNIKALVLDVDGTLTDGKIYIGSQGEMMKAFNSADGLGIDIWRKLGYKIFIITGRNSLIVSKRAAELDIDEVVQGVDDKVNALNIVAERNAINLDEICFIGDDLNDLAAMKLCGKSMAVAQACDFVKENTDLVLSKRGGEGAVREGIEIILKSQGKWEKILKDFIGEKIDKNS